MIRILRTYYLLLAAFTCSLLFVSYTYQTLSTNYDSEIVDFQRAFSMQEAQLDKTLEYKIQELRTEGIEKQWERLEQDPEIYIHVYRHDSLLFWNSNHLPILRFANLHFPANGVQHLQNGWYMTKVMKDRDYVICASFLVRQEYAYKNDALVDDFSTHFNLPFTGRIIIEEERGYPIKKQDGSYAFSLQPDKEQILSPFTSAVLFLLFLGTLSLWLAVLFKFRKRKSARVGWIIVASLILLRFLSLKGNWFGFMQGIEAFDPSLYATSQWLPNFFAYMVNCILIVYVLAELTLWIRQSAFLRRKSWVLFALYILSFGFWIFFLYLMWGIIENSSIPLVIDQLFSLNLYSLLAVASLGVVFFAFYKCTVSLIAAMKETGTGGARLAVVTFFVGCIVCMYEITLGNQIFLASLFPLAFNELLLFVVYRQRNSHQLGLGILTLMLFCLVMASTLEGFNERKERSERELYANQLAMEKNIVTEVEYATMAEQVKEDSYLHRLLEKPQPINVTDFEQTIENRLFHGFWERYEMKFYLFDAAYTLLTETEAKTTQQYEELEEIIHRSGTISEIDSNVYLVHDHSKHYSYIIRQKISVNDSIEGTLYCTLKSKIIPEEIGFPRLLISSDANVLEPLEAYSIAKYHDGRLATRYGSFNYPSARNVLKPSMLEGKGFFDYREFNHFVLDGNQNDTVVLSVKKHTLVDQVTSFSYLFSFFGLLLMPMLFRVNTANSPVKGLSLSMKIQSGLIALVFLSLLTFGWGSGLFVSTQYNQFTNDMIREKLNSVETEVSSKLGRYQRLNIDENGNYMQGILQKFARVFFTDINLYDREGYLLASSRPRVFNVGLLSEQMNPEAYEFMELYKQSEYVHLEGISKLKFSSAYKPFYNVDGVQLGYINLQHFGQQREFENQIQRFLVAIINVFILLLAVSVILAIFISNWLTAPLRILQESFARVKFGKFNEHIHYDRDDEIGSLVKDYNQKLDELEFAAQQLARNEREMAWREMAKQVAHEIKNPLTPMKLSVQQLLRVYDPNDPKSAEKLKAVSNSIIEQIDALTRIANEFSTFGKMPNPSEEKLDLLALIRGVVEVFQGEISIEMKHTEQEIPVVVDKDQFVRVFNNLIKNAVQAIPREQQGHIEIRVFQKDKKVHIEIQDNGAGIPAEEQSKIFVPYFTTKGTGSGLGLAMVKQIIENHRGTIDFESIVGEGTTFMIELPGA